MAAPATRETVFGKRLKQAYLSRTMSQHDLEKAIGVSQGTVSRYISGERKPTGELLAAMVLVLRVSLRWLTKGEGSPNDAELRGPPDDEASDDESNVRKVSAGRRAAAKGAAARGASAEDAFPAREEAIILLGENLDARAKTMLLRLRGATYAAHDRAWWLAQAKAFQQEVLALDRDWSELLVARRVARAKRGRGKAGT